MSNTASETCNFVMAAPREERVLQVKKRNGKSENLDMDKINCALIRVCNGLQNVSPSEVILDAKVQLFDGVTTKEIDQALILCARAKIEKEPEYSLVAARLLLNTLYKEVFGEGVDSTSFEPQYRNAFISNLKLLAADGRINPSLLEFDLELLSSKLVLERDAQFKYLGIQTLYDRYFLHINKRRMETPQSFWMRVAMGLAINEKDKNEKALEFYEVLSQFLYMASTPTLFNSGTRHSQMSSCYLNTFEDSIDGIFDGIWQEARKGKFAGGLGFDVTPFRAAGSYIKGTNGESQGLIPWLKLFNDMLVAVNQGGKRKGAGCAYLEVWHLDFEDFLELRKNTGDERRRAHDMNTAAWVPDLFMEQIKQDGDWHMFSPADARHLHECYGEKFKTEYAKLVELVKNGTIKHFKKVKAKDLWKKMLTMLFETGHPWITFKDPCNLRSPQKHDGVVHSSNLCCEITLNTKPSKYENGEKIETGETAVCNLGSVNLAAHVASGKVNYKLLAKTIKTAVRMLDNVIDINFYPTQEARKSNLKHRPVGLGIMGLVDAMRMTGISYEADESVKFSSDVQEAVSYNAILASSDLALERGAYGSYQGSAWSKGELPIDSYVELMRYRGKEVSVKPTQPWDTLRDKIKVQGMRNSNTMAIAPTATISYIVGCSQSVEPDYSVLFVYSTLSGEFTMVNEFFVAEAKKLGLWGSELMNALKRVDGDISKLPSLPDKLRNGFSSAFNVDQKRLIDCAAARQIWIDQAQSLNLYSNKLKLSYLSGMYFHAWESGLKTTYYLRSLAASSIEKSTGTMAAEISAPKACSIEAMKRGEICESCQ